MNGLAMIMLTFLFLSIAYQLGKQKDGKHTEVKSLIKAGNYSDVLIEKKVD